MVENGETIHLVCQENRPEQFEFISEAYVYELDHDPELLFKRDSQLPGRCISHRPQISLLPTSRSIFSAMKRQCASYSAAIRSRAFTLTM